MEQLRLLLKLEDLGVDVIRNDGKRLFFFPAAGVVLPPFTPEMQVLIEKNRAWLIAHTRKLTREESKQLA